jgi:hypothetical protein
MVTVRERIEVAEGKEEKFLSQKILCHLCLPAVRFFL